MAYTIKRTLLTAGAVAGLLLSAGTLTSGRAQGPPLGTAADDGVLLLRNGQVLEGTIAQNGDRYEVAVHGGWISVKAAEVELRCEGLDDVYRRLCAMRTFPTAADHIDLARWCQSHGLLDPAARELAQAKSLAPDHPMIPLLTRRLRLAADPKPLSPAGTAHRVATPSYVDLDKFARQLPPGTVEAFARTMQPLLLNHCAAAGCHGPGSPAELSLLRSAPGRPPSRRMTQRNLHAVMACIDRENPEASPLLTAPIRPHGTAVTPLFAEQNVGQYKQLVDWVYRTSGAGEPVAAAVPAEHIEPDQPSSATIPAVYSDPGTSDLVPGVELGPSWAERLGHPGAPGLSLSETFSDDALAAPSTPVPLPPVQRGAALPGFKPRDPFDPEVFNRRFHGLDRASTGANRPLSGEPAGLD